MHSPVRAQDGNRHSRSTLFSFQFKFNSLRFLISTFVHFLYSSLCFVFSLLHRKKMSRKRNLLCLRVYLRVYQFTKYFRNVFLVFEVGFGFVLLGGCAGYTTVGQNIRKRTARFRFKSQAKSTSSSSSSCWSRNQNKHE